MLKLEDVTLKFGGLTAVNHVSLSMADGGIHALIGPNGAGKTTVFNLISGVYTPDEGVISFQGKDLNGRKPHRINQAGIARTYQNINLFKSMTCVENVMVGHHCRMKSGIWESIIRTGKQKQEERETLEKCMELLCMFHLENHAYDRSNSLSYGEQRLLEIARAMASDPKLLLLDEPAAGMNETEKEQLSSYIRDVRKTGIDILIVEHDMKLIMNIADCIHVLNFGKKIA